MLRLTVISLLVYIASAQDVANINNFTDAVLLEANKFLTKAGLGVQKLPDHSVAWVQLTNGVQIGMNSLYRSADCFLTYYENGTQYVDVHVGLKLFDLAYGSIRTKKVDMSGIYRIRNNSFHISYSVVTKPECKVSLDDYQFEVMTDVPFESSIPKYDADMSEVFSGYVLPRLNKKISHLKEKVETQLQSIICRDQENLITDHSMGIYSSIVHPFR